MAFPRRQDDAIPLDSARALWDQLQELGVDYLVEIERGRLRLRSETKDPDDFGNSVFRGFTGESRAAAAAALDALNATGGDGRWVAVTRPRAGLIVNSASRFLGVHTIKIVPWRRAPEEERRHQILTAVRAILRQTGMTTD